VATRNPSVGREARRGVVGRYNMEGRQKKGIGGNSSPTISTGPVNSVGARDKFTRPSTSGPG